MKKHLLSILLSCSCMIISAQSHAQTWQWAKTSNQCDDPISLIEAGWSAIDNRGNIYSTGFTNGTCTIFGADTIPNVSGITFSMFLVKYDSVGHYKWSRNAGPGSDGVSIGVATDASGNVYWSGYFNAPSATFGSHTLTTGAAAGFLVKYDSLGNVLWAKKQDGYVSTGSLTISNDGNLYVVGGYTSSELRVDTFILTNSGFFSDFFLLKYDLSGNVIWARSAGSGGYNDFANFVSCDGSGNVYITGRFYSPNLNIGTTTLTNPDSMRESIFVAKYNSSGTALWAKEAHFPGGPTCRPYAYIKADVAGNLYMTGSFDTDSFVMGSFVFRNDSVSRSDFFLAKFDPAGNILWAQRGGGKGDDAGHSMTIDDVGNLWVAGGSNYEDSFILDTTHIYISSLPDAAFIAKFSPSGHLMYHTSLEFGGDDYLGIEADHSGNIYISGDYIWGPYYVGSDTMNFIGLENFMVAKLGGAFDLTPLHMLGNPLANNVSIFPNPATNEFCITTEVPIGNSSVSISNNLGQEVKNVSIVLATTKISTTDMPSGMYICKVMVNGNVSVHKLVVR